LIENILYRGSNKQEEGLMNTRDFKFYLWSWPFLGAFISFMLCIMFKTNDAAVVIMLGVIGGYIALIAYILGIRYLEEKGYITDKDKEQLSGKE
jgi:hypothetical protein